MRTFILFLTVIFSVSLLSAQQQAAKLVTVNGGQFGSTNYANVMVKDLQTGTETTIDTIYVTSIQDVLVDGDYAYVAAQDSIVKYDLTTNSRVAAEAFIGGSTIKLAKYDSTIVVGNWYKPWGHTGPYNFHLNMYAAADLTLLDSVPQVQYPAKDFVIVGDTAYVAQNAGSTTSYSDTLGFVAVVDLTTNTVVREDTLSAANLEVGRMLVQGTKIFTLNSVSNTVSSYDISTGAKSTVAFANSLDLKPRSNGPAAQFYNNNWYFAYDSGIGSYDLMNNTVVEANIVKATSAAFTMNKINGDIYVSNLNFSAAGTGVVYNIQGDSINSFSTGISGEALAIAYEAVTTALTTVDAVAEMSVYPNPVNDVLNVTLENGAYDLMIHNANGQVIWSAKVEETATVNVSALTPGMYFMTAVSELGAVQTKRFVKAN